MQKVDPQSLVSYLNQSQIVAQNLGSVSFDGWRCPQCHPEVPPTAIHIRTYVLNSRKFLDCPNCQELTVERTSKATKKGQKLITEKCKCCNYYQTIVQPVSKTGSYGSNGYTDGGAGGGSWGDSGGFGGGDCGGGGADGGW
jgi:uncharacterized protein